MTNNSVPFEIQGESLPCVRAERRYDDCTRTVETLLSVQSHGVVKYGYGYRFLAERECVVRLCLDTIREMRRVLDRVGCRGVDDDALRCILYPLSVNVDFSADDLELAIRRVQSLWRGSSITDVMSMSLRSIEGGKEKKW